MTLLADFQFGLLAFNPGLLFMEVLLFVTSFFLMLLILVQRGKGGGLTGALGGMGGQSAFGSKAGDAFTKITVVTAMIWITLCMITIAAFNPPPRSADLKSRKVEQAAPDSTPDASGATDGTPKVEGAVSAGTTGAQATDQPAGKSTDDGQGIQLNLDGPASTNTDSPTKSESTPGATSPADDKKPADGSADSSGK